MSKTMKNTATITIPASKLVKGDIVVYGKEQGGDRKVTSVCRAGYQGGDVEVEFGMRCDACYDHDQKVTVRRSFSKLSKAQLTKALKAVQKQQNTLACQAGDLQDALAELERTAKPAKNTYKVVKAAAVKVGDSIDSLDFPAGFQKVKSVEHHVRRGELEFKFANAVPLCLYAYSSVFVLKTK